jgi:putative SOS response-associated peptidase YedK
LGTITAWSSSTRSFENVERDGKNAVLQFTPRPPREMLVACLYARWGDPGKDELLSFAAITDEPPREVADAGHDRCIINIKEQNVDAWLSPEGRELAKLRAILDDVECPYYEHQVQAA